jgi:hypothetical protein
MKNRWGRRFLNTVRIEKHGGFCGSMSENLGLISDAQKAGSEGEFRSGRMRSMGFS